MFTGFPRLCRLLFEQFLRRDDVFHLSGIYLPPGYFNSEMGALTKAAMTAASYITFVFSFLFVLYSISAFLKARMKEFGILTVLGAAGGQFNRLIFLENMIMGTAAVVAGIVGGLVFSKLFLMLGTRALEMKELPMYFPGKAWASPFHPFSPCFWPSP